ncbi:membrane protein involved in the export of O-antigen and teichoic acid [Halogeometricum pallidum JCM 14848]|uniref:Membrane protein involved in the export of O-antigen and teichoic acid n=1 Tax=Halogeometricum pallidum JCM 14848 TaxID=1227487 RepID=M0D9H9_HALPD|nr:flippase [Halogeometricum pallidum]ELZ31372.1 membrane protein involved in the export of O-antigen and teichoic acid [Halogeometricum pallidum JCM 14848]
MNIARSSFKLFGANIVSSATAFLGIAYFAQELGAAPMGVFFLFQAMLGLLAIPADFGLRGAVEKRISEGESQGEFLTSAVILKLVPITLIVAGILLLQSYVNNYIGENVAILLAAAIILQEAAQFAVVVLKGELRVGETAVLRLARQVSWVGVSTLFVTQGYGALGLIYGLLTALGVMFVLGLYKCSTSPSRPSIKHARSLFNYSRYNVVSSIGGYFYSWMDVAIIGLFLSQAHVGAYETAWRVTTIVVLLSDSIASALFPQVSRWNANNAKSRIESTIQETITPSMILVIPSFFGTLIFSSEILELIFGPEFAIASLVLIVLMGEKIVQSVHIIFGKALQGINRPDLAAYATVTSVLTNLVLNLIFVVQFGIIGAAMATTISFSMNAIIHGYYLSKFMDIRFPYSEISWCVLSSVGMALFLEGLRSLIVVNNVVSLVTAISAGALVYWLLIFTSKSLRVKLVTQAKSLVS